MSQQAFLASLRAAARGLWQGKTTPLEAADGFFSAIRRGFDQAWTEGALSASVNPDERTQAEQDKLNLLIGDNFQYVGRLADWIYQNSKPNGGKWGDVDSRLELWVNRYQEVKAQAQTMANADQKLKWVIDGGEHCRTCLKLNGRVARASVWAANNIAPRMVTDRLVCGGYRCKCTFVPTTEKATRGRFPNLP